MTFICNAMKAFEQECAAKMDEGVGLAERSNLVYGSRLTNLYPEPYFTLRLLSALSDLKKNNIQVLFSPERHTGSDIEIHILHSLGGWTGLRIQGKKAKLDGGVFKFNQLDYTTDQSEEPLVGDQNHKLFTTSLAAGMVPLYLYYLPTPVVARKSGRSGAMIGSAWDAQRFIQHGTLNAETVLAENTYPISHLLCPLDYSLKDFKTRIADLYRDHVEPEDHEADLTQDIEDLAPGYTDLEDSVYEDVQGMLMERTPSPAIQAVFDMGGGYHLPDGVCGAAFIDERLFGR